MSNTAPETLEDILADLTDVSLTETSESLSCAEGVETLEDRAANLDDAEEALKEALKELRALKRRTAKAIAQVAGRRTNDEDEE